MAAIAYLLCMGTALGCATLLTRAYRATRVRLLFWSALCFWGLTISNTLLFIDLYVVPDRDLYWARLSVGLLAMWLLLYGLVWEGEVRR